MDRSTIDYYNENAEKLAELYETADMSIVHSLLLRFLPEKASVLEIGCGSGRDAAFLIAKGYDVTAALTEKMKHRKPDIYIHPEISDVRMFDFNKIEDVYRQAQPAIDELRALVQAKILEQ